MKTRNLALLLLTFVLIWYAAPTTHAAGPPDPPDRTDIVQPPLSDLGDEPIEPQDGPAGGLDNSSMFPGTPSFAIWHVETVDSEGDVGSYSSLALDRAGHPHTSYFDSSNGNLKYAWYDGVNWHVETVDSEGVVGSYSSLALDGAGHPHISYYDFSNYDLKYAWHNGTNWQIETVDSEGDVGSYSSLTLDGAGHPHISYFDRGNQDLKYAWHDGATWHTEWVDIEGDVGYYTSLALDDLGRPHISYQYEDYYYYCFLSSLKHAWHDGTAWHIETVDESQCVGELTSLALDGLGRPHISYHNDGLMYAWYDGVNWQIETVDSEGDVGRSTSLALDGTGYPHISYDGGNGDLKYAWHDGTDWQIEIADSEGGAVGYTSLVLDERDYPRISYYDRTYKDLKYAWRRPFSLDKQVAPSDSLNDIDALTHTLTYSLTLLGPSWNFFLHDPLPPATRYVSGSLTSTLTPPAIYSPTLNAVVWEGTLPTNTIQTAHFQVTLAVTSTRFLSAPLSIINTAWLTATEDRWGIAATAAIDVTPPPFALDKKASFDGAYLYNGDLLTYTLDLAGPDLNFRLWDPLPDTVRYVPGSLTSSLTPPAVYSPTTRAIIWEGTLPTDTSKAVRFHVTADVGYVGDQAPSLLPLVNVAWLTATESGRSVPAMVRVDVMIPPSTDNWQIETVDSEGVVGHATSLALDETDRPHIGYGGGGLKYAWNNGTNWQIETVDSGEYVVWRYTSLALDEAGHPHISYYDLGNRDLKYAWHNGTNWQIETVDSEGDVGWDNSLALDGAGHPHISYRDHTNYDLKYAWHNGTSWQIETVDSERFVDYDTSLALDEAGRPHISYSSGVLIGFHFEYHLKYAWHNGTNWQIETVDSKSQTGQKNSLALDERGHPHISYFDITNGDLKYARYNGANWQIETVDSEGNVGWANSLALDEAGHPHISYYDDTNDDLKYAWHNGTNWQIETLDSAGYVGRYTSLALDEAGHPHISYYDYANGDLKYVRPLPFSLNKQVALNDSLNDIDALTHTLTYSLTLFGPGVSVHFQDPLPDTVHYVPGSIASTLTPPAVYSPTRNAVVWEGTLPTNTAQTIRFQVTPRITATRFLSAPLSIVNAAWMDDDLEDERRVLDTAITTITPPPLALETRATPNYGLRNDDTLTYTLTISGPDLNVRLRDPLPPLVQYVPGSVTGTVTPMAVYNPTAHAVVWQGTLPTDTVQTVQFQVTLGVTGTGSLSLPIVNTAWLTNTDSGWSVSATAIVNGWYVYVPLVLRSD